MFKQSIRLCFALLIVCAATVPNSYGQNLVFKANLDQAQSGGTGSAATGTAVLCLDQAMTQLTINVNLTGITTSQITAFHIHQAPAGMNGGVVFGMVAPNHDLNDFVDLGTGYASRWDPVDTTTGATSLPSLIPTLNASGLYFNAHTAAFPAGEIRGQIVPVFFGDMNLDGAKDLLDVAVFVNLLSTGGYQIEGDFNKDGVLNLIDVMPFVTSLVGGC